MDASGPATTGMIARDAARPRVFLVSTPQLGDDPHQALGRSDYSYRHVFESLRPVLERFGQVVALADPARDLSPLAAEAARRGDRPLHLALTPPHRALIPPDLPTLLFPFWEFPRIPDRDIAGDPRQNWARASNQATAIITACHFTAQAFRDAGVDRPIAVIPVPLAHGDLELPDWDPARGWSITCRHRVWGPYPPSDSPVQPRGASRIRQALKQRYRRYLRPWLSDRALEQVTRIKRTMLTCLNRPPERLEPDVLELGGLVYTSIFNLGDQRKNPSDMLSAFVLAFRDRPDVTLVLKLVANPETEVAAIQTLDNMLTSLGVPFACRVVGLVDYLSEDDLKGLLGVTTYYLNTSHGEGACLPLQKALAAGRPAIAPAHTAMADYMDEQVGFVVRSHREPAHWPHDPQRRYETHRYRLVWSDLHDHLLRSARLIKDDRQAYDRMSQAARVRLRELAGPDRVAAALATVLEQLDTAPQARRSPAM